MGHATGEKRSTMIQEVLTLRFEILYFFGMPVIKYHHYEGRSEGGEGD